MNKKAARGRVLLFRSFTGAVLCSGLLLGMCLGCATGDPGTRMGSDPGGGDGLLLQAGAYGNEYFSVNKPMKIRPPNDYVHYFKHCNLLGRRPFYLQNEYGCTPPP
jgi:hypothetical protein